MQYILVFMYYSLMNITLYKDPWGMFLDMFAIW